MSSESDKFVLEQALAQDDNDVFWVGYKKCDFIGLQIRIVRYASEIKNLIPIWNIMSEFYQ